MEDGAGWLKELIRDIPDFPRPGVTFKDLTPLLADASGLATCIRSISAHFESRRVDKVVGIEARGFIIAAPVAVELGAGFVPVRKVGKLPHHAHSETYDLEYGTDTLEVHADALQPTESVLIVDDVLATGGTAAATVRLIGRIGATVAGFGCVVELGFLGGRGKLQGLDTVSLIRYE
jgi:adenine phosphoribosyltransferase